jgi:hypothetical protein
VTASEKLKALHEQATHRSLLPHLKERMAATTAVIDVLPQIVALVEAAEQFPDLFVAYDDDGGGETMHSFVPLLAALEEALL